VPGGSDEIRAPVLDTHRHLAGRLDGIHEHLCARVVGNLDDLPNRQPRPVVPRDGTQTDESCTLDGIFQRVDIEVPAFGRYLPN
jgi:hypothetical protein